MSIRIIFLLLVVSLTFITSDDVETQNQIKSDEYSEPEPSHDDQSNYKL